MELDIIREKREFYKNKLIELDNKNIDEIVNERLELQRKEIEEKVRKEIEVDKIKCNHYLDILFELENEIQCTVEKEYAKDEMIEEEKLVEEV